MIKVNCPNCGVRLTAPADFVGRPVTCQKCNTKFILSKRWTNQPLNPPRDTPEKSAAKSETPPLDIPTAVVAEPLSPPKSSTARNQELGSSQSSNRQDGDVLESAIPVGILPPTDLPDSGEASADVLGPFLGGISKRKSGKSRGMPTLTSFVEAHSIWELFDFRFRRYLTPWILRISWVLILLVSLIWFFFLSFAYAQSLAGKEKSIQFADLPTPGDQESVAGSQVVETGMHLPGWFIELSSRFLFPTAVYLTSVAIILLAVLWLRVLFETIIVLFGMASSLRAIDVQRSNEQSAHEA